MPAPERTRPWSSVCLSAAFPPIRPDFDAAGGSNGSNVTFHGITGSPTWQRCRLPPTPNGGWQAIYSGDPYTAWFIQVRSGIPLRALIDSFQSVWTRLANLPEAQRQVYDLLTGLAPAAPQVDLSPAQPITRPKFRPKTHRKRRHPKCR